MRWAWLAAILLTITAVAAEPVPSSQIRVIDGDTIELAGHPTTTRLVGFDTPETFGDDFCEGERALGSIATARVRELVAAGPVEVSFVACSCPPGTEGTDLCNYGRDCAALSVAGRDIGTILIAEGLADPLVCGPTRCPPLTRSWCSR